MDHLAAILLLLFFSGLLLALVRGGWTGHGGAKQWWKSKFLGQPQP